MNSRRVKMTTQTTRLTIALAAFLWIAPAQTAAQTPTVHVQAHHIGDAATTMTLGLQLTRPLGKSNLPKPGQQDESETRPWLFAAGLGGGYSWAKGSGSDNGLTAVAHAGLMYRAGKLVDQVGVVGYLNTTPFGAGPAVRAKVAILDLQLGGMWIEHRQGFRWFVGGGISLQFLCDVFCR